MNTNSYHIQIFKTMNINVTIPEKLSDIKLNQYQEYLALIEKEDADDNFVNRRLLSIFYDIKPDMYDKLKVKDIEHLIIALSKVLEDKPKLQRTFEFAGVEYGFIPNLDNMTFGEFVDLNKFSETKDLHKLMSVLFRPIKNKRKHDYLIEAYEGAHSDFLETPANIILGCISFFLTIAQQLAADILKSSIKDHPMETKKLLAENGLGINQLTHLQKGTFLDTMKLQS